MIFNISKYLLTIDKSTTMWVYVDLRRIHANKVYICLVVAEYSN